MQEASQREGQCTAQRAGDKDILTRAGRVAGCAPAPVCGASVRDALLSVWWRRPVPGLISWVLLKRSVGGLTAVESCFVISASFAFSTVGLIFMEDS